MPLGKKFNANGFFGTNADVAANDYSMGRVSRGPSRKRSKKSKKNTTARRQTRRRPSHSGRVRHTKNGQPYIIMKNGRAKFIKKRGSR